jgi:hypothetical protein
MWGQDPGFLIFDFGFWIVDGGEAPSSNQKPSIKNQKSLVLTLNLFPQR